MSATRWLLRGVCALAMLLSAFFAAHGVLVTAGFLTDDIPAGKIEAITAHTKMGLRIRLDTGGEAVFPYSVLFQQPKRVELKVGDQVEKRRHSVVYVVNGVTLTDVRWMLRNWLLPIRLVVPLCTYLIVGTIYILAYKRTPLGDCLWADADQKRPLRPHTQIGMIVAMLSAWLVVAVVATMVFGCIGSCLSGIGKAVMG